MATTKRRKYTFQSREAAEEAYRVRDRHALLSSVMLNAAINGKIQWMKGRYGDKNTAYYEFGVFHRRFDSLVVVRFLCQQTGQDPHAAAYDEDWLSEEIRRYRIVCDDELQRGYRDGLDKLKVFLDKTRPAGQ